MPTPDEIRLVQQILSQNRGKDFVERIVNPGSSPRLDLGDGNYATHRMAWASSDGGYFVYPTVVRQGDSLRQLQDREAWDYAMKTGEFIRFDDPKTADWFSKSYKSVWDAPKPLDSFLFGGR